MSKSCSFKLKSFDLSFKLTFRGCMNENEIFVLTVSICVFSKK